MRHGASDRGRAPGVGGGEPFDHGPVLILNLVAAAQLALILMAREYRVLPTFGFILLIDLAYGAAAPRRGAPAGGRRRV